jgi:hypothetical protein
VWFSNTYARYPACFVQHPPSPPRPPLRNFVGFGQLTPGLDYFGFRRTLSLPASASRLVKWCREGGPVPIP